MRTKAITFVLFLISSICNCQISTFTSSFTSVNPQSYLMSRNVISLPDGGTAVFRQEINSTSPYRFFFRLIKANSLGNIIWNKCYSFNGIDYYTSFARTPDNGFLVSGVTYLDSVMFSNKVALVIKIDSMGDLQWGKCFSMSGYLSDDIRSLSLADGSSIHVVNTDQWLSVMKLDSAGTLIWSGKYCPSVKTYVKDVISTNDGGVAILSDYGPDVIMEKYILMVKIDSSGELSWANKYNWNYSRQHSVAILEAANSDLLVYGSEEYNSLLFLLRTDQTGNALWYKTYEDSLVGYINSAEGKLIDAGNKFVFSGFNNNFTVMTEINSLGGIQWCKKYTYENLELKTETQDNGLVLEAFTQVMGQSMLYKTDALGNNNCNSSPYILKVKPRAINQDRVDSSGVNQVQDSVITMLNLNYGLVDSISCSTTGIYEPEKKGSMISVFPNPSNGDLYVECSGSSESSSLTIFDSFGREIYALKLDNTLAGKRSIHLSKMAAGVYYLFLSSGNNVQTKKVIVEN